MGGTPYPIFWLDLAIALPTVAAVGILLIRDRPAGPPLAMVALVKIVTLFTALWAGPLLALVTGRDVVLGLDAGLSLTLSAASSCFAARWYGVLTPAKSRRSGPNCPDGAISNRPTVVAWRTRSHV